MCPTTANADADVQLSPSRLDIAAARGDRLPTMTLRNGSDDPLAITVEHRPVTHDLTGFPARDAGRRPFLRVEPSSFTLAPHSHRAIRATLTGGPTRGIGAYGSIVATATPQDGRKRSVGRRVSLNGVVLVRMAGRAAPAGRVIDARLAQTAPRVFSVFARVRNTGNIHVRPHARLMIRDAGGRVVWRGGMQTGNVIPQADRELPAAVTRILPAGRYSATVTMRVGGASSSRTRSFALSGPNVLPTPDLGIAALTTPSPGAGDDVTATVRVRNAGTAPGAVSVRAALVPAGGGASSATRTASTGAVAPGESIERDFRLPGKDSGAHMLRVELRVGDRIVDERSVTFTVAQGAGPLLPRILDWIAGHLPIVFGAVFWIILALTAGAALRIRKLRRRLAAAGATGARI